MEVNSTYNLYNAITVLMPVYNTPVEHLSVAVTSLLSQDTLPYEIIIINDGSDCIQTNVYLESVCKHDRIRIVNLDSNLGIARALNTGLLYVKTGLTMRFDSDDIADPRLISKMKNCMTTRPDVNICGCQIKAFGHLDWQSYLSNEVTKKNALQQPYIANHPGITFRTEWFFKQGGYVNTPKGTPEDLPTWANILLKGETIYHIDDVLVHYRTYDRPPLSPDVQAYLNTWLDKLNPNRPK